MDQRKLKTWFKAQGLTMRDVAHATGYAYTHLVEMVNGTAPLSEHGAPLRCRGLCPQAEEAKPGRFQNGRANAQCRLDLQRDQAAGQNVSPQQATGRDTNSSRGQNVLPLFGHQHTDAHQAGVSRNGGEGDRV